jgi:phosphoribosylanthranilate isomerase
VSVDIKFCGMMRGEDVRVASALGAAYVGVILTSAGGPRTLAVDRAAAVLAEAPRLGELGEGLRKVGVFGRAATSEIGAAAQALGLDIVQLHGEWDANAISEVKSVFSGEVWPVLRLADGTLPPTAPALFEVADAIVLDAYVPGKLGGTGVTLPWRRLADELAPVRGRARLVLAGGLRPDNVGEANRLLRPEVVDVSSGVETAPGIKDHARMRAFRDAVRESE